MFHTRQAIWPEDSAANPWFYLSLLFAAIILYPIINCLKTVYRPDLSSLPGPNWARFTSLYRVYLLWSGEAPSVYQELHNKYGPVVRTGPNHLSISDPAAIPIIYGFTTAFIKSRFYLAFIPIYQGKPMESLFSVRDPAAHKALRKPVAANFSMTSIRTMEPHADQCYAIFEQTMKELEGQKVDLGEWLHWYAFDVIGAITFNRRLGFMEDRTDVMNMISDNDFMRIYCSLVGQVPTLHFWLVGNQLLMKTLKSVLFLNMPNPLKSFVQFTEQCIDENDEISKDEEGEGRTDFLTYLRLQDKTKNNIPYRDLVGYLTGNLLAGSDTTAISLRAILYFVVQTPEVYQRLQKEIDDADAAGKLSKYITYAECLDLEYLQVVMKEAMRCHPGVSFPLERLVPEGGAELCGTKIAAGTVVGINPVVVHQDKEIFGADAARFRPERWLEATKEQVKIMDRTLLTFGAGTRSCTGKNISIMEMGKLVPQILRHFNLYWASDQPEWDVKTYWFAKQTQFFVRFESRIKPST